MILCQKETITPHLPNLENKTEIVAEDFTKKIKPDLEKKVLPDITNEKKTSGIYKIINKINGKYYIGSTTRLTGDFNRWYKHKHKLINNNHINDHLQSAWNKYGEIAFEFIIVEKVPEEKLIEVEQKYLDKASTEKDKCYNASFIASRVEWTDEVKNKRRIYLKNHLSIPENNSMFGKKHSKKSREKMRQKAIGRKFSAETRKKLSIARKRQIPGTIDHKIYTFKNTATNEIFVGTRHSFYTKYDFFCQSISRLIHGKQKSVNGCWILQKA